MSCYSASTKLTFTTAIWGWIADRTPDRKVTFYCGLIIQLAATITFGLANGVIILVISRLFQGLSEAAVLTIGLVIIVDTVGNDEIGRWTGTVMSSLSFGLIISPLVGGIVYDSAGYMAVFGLVMGVVSINILMGILMVLSPARAQRLQSQKPTPGSAMSTTLVQEHTLSGSHLVAEYHPHAPQLSSKRDSQSLLATEDTPLIPKKEPILSQIPPIITLLVNPRVLASIYGIFVNFTVLSTFDGTLPLFVSTTFNWDSLATGLIFLFLAVPALAGPLVGMLSDRIGPRWITVTGCAFTSIPLVLMRLVVSDSTSQKALLCSLLFLTGCTLVAIVAPCTSDLSIATEEIEAEQPGIFGPGGAYAQAFSLLNMSIALGTVVGPVVGGWLKNSYGWGTMTLVLGLLAFSGAVPSVSSFSSLEL
jgi:MFS family permease